VYLRCILFAACFFFFTSSTSAQLKWQNVDSLYGPLPSSVHVYKTTDLIDGKPNIAFYVEADLKDTKLYFTTDTTYKRRLTPSQFYKKGYDSLSFTEVAFNFPLIVVNTTFFSFATNQNLNMVIQNGKLVSYNIHTINGRGKDTFTYRHPFASAIGISKKREADIAWTYTDSSQRYAYGSQSIIEPFKDSVINHSFSYIRKKTKHHYIQTFNSLKKWKMQTAVGGGPVLLQDGEILVTNNQELKFVGKAIEDKHPRTAMGYTKNGKLIIMVIEGRHPGIAEGATLTQEAQIFKDLGCWEALNLDGGGSSCMLVNGKETIKVSDATGQRPVPAVFIIKSLR
jgi:Phosphodiester glycosidase